jgi:phytoene dehydrogenase-like protein
MPTNTYDLIVLGDELAGLVAGTLCARRGMRVLHARTGVVPEAYQLGPYKLPARALALVGLGTPAIKRVIDELSFDHLLKRKLIEHAPAFQLVAPDARIDVGTDDVVLHKELARELPAPAATAAALEGAAAIANQLDAVLGPETTFPPAGFWERREVGRSTARLEEEAAAWFAAAEADPIARSFVELAAALHGRTNPLDLSPLGRARALATWRQGTPRLPGDYQTLREILTEKMGSHSGEVRSVRPAELLWSWGKAAGLRLESGEELGAEHIIAALPLEQLAPLVDKKHPKQLAKLIEGIRPAGWRYTLNLVVAEGGIPEGMARTVLVVVDPSAPPIGANAFAIHRGEPDSEARVVVTIEAVCPLPEAGEKLQDTFADLRVALRERLDLVMPFIGEHVVLAHSPHEGVPAEGAEGALELAEPLKPLPVWASQLDPYIGLTAVPYQVGIKHLTVASSQVIPGLGIEGDFIAGTCAARIACQSAGKKRDYLQEERAVIAGAKR